MVDVDQLAERARDGDTDGLARFVETVQADVWRFCAHLTRPADADDLAQETLLRVVANLHRWEQRSVMPWVLGVARNVCFEHLRRQMRRRTDPVAEPAIAAAPDLSGTVDVAQLLAALPADQREAIVLTQLIGLSYAEAAEVVSCPVGTIRSRVARGRDGLAAAMRIDRVRRHTGRHG